MARHPRLGLLGLVVVAALVCASCGLVVRDEKAQRIDGVAGVADTAQDAAAAAPTLPPTTIWVEPHFATGDTTPGTPSGTPSDSGDGGSPEPVASTTTTTTEPPSPYCIAFSAFVAAGTKFTLQQQTATRDELVAHWSEMDSASATMTSNAPKPIVAAVDRLRRAVGTAAAEVSSIPTKDVLLARLPGIVGDVTPLIDPVIAAAPQYCASFRGPDAQATAEEGYAVLSQK
jgi:hypothetical protein